MLTSNKITYVSDSTAKPSVFFIGCYRGTFRSLLWFMWIQMIPKLSYPLWFIYEMRQALRLAGEKLSELLLTSATDLTSRLAGCYRCVRLLQFHCYNMCVVEFVVHAKGVFVILNSYWGSVIIYSTFFLLQTRLAKFHCVFLKTHYNFPNNSTFIWLSS